MSPRARVPAGIPSFYFRNSSGRADGLWTMAVMSFAATCALIIAALTPYGDRVAAILPEVIAWFGVCLAGYTGRRFTAAKYGIDTMYEDGTVGPGPGQRRRASDPKPITAPAPAALAPPGPVAPGALP